MRTLLQLVYLVAIVTKSTKAENDVSLYLQPAKDSYLLQKNSEVLLNCTITIKKSEYGETKLKLAISNQSNKTLATSERVLKTEFYGYYAESITSYLPYEDQLSTQNACCYAYMNDTHLKRSIEIIYEREPTPPSNVTLIYGSKHLIYYSRTFPSITERKQLQYKYHIEMMGAKCHHNLHLENILTRPCTIHISKNNDQSTEVLLCLADNYIYNNTICEYQVTLHTENRFGNLQTPLPISKTHPAVIIENVYATDHDFLVVLNPINMATDIFDVHYVVRYHSEKEQPKRTPAHQKGINILKIANLSPNTCYRVSIQFKLFFKEKLLHTSNWTEEEMLCTKAKVILMKAEDLRCWKRNTTDEETELQQNPTVELSWKKPIISAVEYGRIDSYKLTVQFVSISAQPRMTYAITSTSNKLERFVSQMHEYNYGGHIRYRLHLCNNNGCSENFVECSVHIPIVGATLQDRPAQLNIILACVIPAVCFLVLVIGGFVSYYRKKEIQKDLSCSFSSSINGNTNFGASISSRDSSLSEQQKSTNLLQLENEHRKISDEKKPEYLKKTSSSSMTSESGVMTAEKSAQNDKHVNDNVLSVNRQDIARLFIHTFSPASKNKLKGEPLLNGEKPQQIAGEQAV